MDTFSLQELVIWLLTGGGAGVVAFALVEKIPALANLLPDYKRYVSLAITGAVAVAAWFFSVWMTWTVAPTGAQAWVEAIVSVIGTAIITSQVIHGATSLRKERLAIQGH
jgi:hypothetical protein